MSQYHDDFAVPGLIAAIAEILPFTVLQEETLSSILEHDHVLPKHLREEARLAHILHFTFQHLIIFAIENGALSRDTILECAALNHGRDGIRCWEQFFKEHEKCAEVLRIHTQKLDYNHFAKKD